MDTFFSTHYRSGEEIHAEDRISLDGASGHVVFVLGHQLPAEWSPAEDWFRQKFGRGFMLDVQGMGPTFMEESDDDLQFLGRK